MLGRKPRPRALPLVQEPLPPGAEAVPSPGERRDRITLAGGGALQARGEAGGPPHGPKEPGGEGGGRKAARGDPFPARGAAPCPPPPAPPARGPGGAPR